MENGLEAEWGRTERDRRRKKERLRLQPSVRLAGIQTTTHRAQAHASPPLPAIVAQSGVVREQQALGTARKNNNKNNNKHRATAEHKLALVSVNRARNAISAGGWGGQRNMQHLTPVAK